MIIDLESRDLTHYLPRKCRCGRWGELEVAIVIARNSHVQFRLRCPRCLAVGSNAVPHRLIVSDDLVTVIGDNRDATAKACEACGAHVAPIEIDHPLPGTLSDERCPVCLSRIE